MLGSWKELVREVAGVFRIFKVLRLESRSPRTGQALEFFTIDCADWVNVIALPADGNLILFRPFWRGSSTFSVDVPGGGGGVLCRGGGDRSSPRRRQAPPP